MVAPRLIVALDFSKRSEVMNFLSAISPSICALKVGSELFTQLGPDFVHQLVQAGYKVFLDLKFHDIPNTVARACKVAAQLGVWMVNVHASGGFDMMKAAREAIDDQGDKRPLLIAVTVLTSMNESVLPSVGVTSSINDHVKRLALLSQQAGLDGVVCSAHEAGSIKTLCGSDFLTVTPGIRLANDGLNDQVRVMDPITAIKAGSDYLVMGRSITAAKSPSTVISSVLATLSN